MDFSSNLPVSVPGKSMVCVENDTGLSQNGNRNGNGSVAANISGRDGGSRRRCKVCFNAIARFETAPCRLMSIPPGDQRQGSALGPGEPPLPVALFRIRLPSAARNGRTEVAEEFNAGRAALTLFQAIRLFAVLEKHATRGYRSLSPSASWTPRSVFRCAPPNRGRGR